MATWGAHMRIAERILSLYPNFDEEKFVVGNLGPDCNKANEDWTEFEPPKKITHWIDEENKIRPDNFYRTYVDKKDYALPEYSFLIGYYVHLLSDLAFSQFMKHKKESEEYKPLKTDKNFIWTIKKDWYDLDFKYFYEHPNNIFNKTVQHIKNFPDYLDYFPDNAFTEKLKHIIDFYSNTKRNFNREYTYLTQEEMDRFVGEASRDICYMLVQKGLLNIRRDNEQMGMDNKSTVKVIQQN